MKKTPQTTLDLDTGFTLVELMIAIVISMIITAAIYASYKVQQKTATAQSQVTEIQQNLRAGFNLISNNLKMAGYDPEGSGKFGITTAAAGRIMFTTDTNEDGVVDDDERIAFGFSVAVDGDDDGRPDAGGTDSLGVGNWDAGTAAFIYQPIAEEIERIQFLYTLADVAGVAQPPTLTPADPAEIRSVTVSIIARAAQEDYDYTDIKEYTLWDDSLPTPDWNNFIVPFDNNFRRRLLTSRVNCRNMGL